MGEFFRYKKKTILILFISLLSIIWNTPLQASNYKWTQSDWSGGADINASAVHPSNQTGWAKFSSSDPRVNITTPGELSISSAPALWTQSTEVDFNSGSISNLVVLGGTAPTNTLYEETSAVYTGNWGLATDPKASGGKKYQTFLAGPKATFTFNGTGVSWLGTKAWSHGIANVYIDGALQGSVDLYCNPSVCTEVLYQTVWSISGLANQQHTLVIESTGTKNPQSTGTWVIVDAFIESVVLTTESAYLSLQGMSSFRQGSDKDFKLGTLTNLNTVGGVVPAYTGYEEDSAVLTGNWGIAPDANASGGYKAQTFVAGTKASFTFTGTGVSWIGSKSWAHGIANVSIDGVFKGAVDLYNPTALDQQVLWSIGYLSDTTHTLEIYVTGQKNDYSTNAWVIVDAFSVEVYPPTESAYLTITNTASQGVYISPSFSAGTDGATFHKLNWNGTVPLGSTLRFQIATNKNNLTWNFVGPDGTANTFYTISGDPLFSGHGGDTYIKFKAFFIPSGNGDSPTLDDVTIDYSNHGIYISAANDVGERGASFTSISWNPTVAPPGASLKFQIATNKNNLTWNFVGPDGTANTFYETSGAQIFSGHLGDRYIMLKAYFSPSVAGVSSTLEDVTIDYGVIPSVQVLNSSHYDTTDTTNGVRRLRWSEDMPAGTDIVLQLRTSSNKTVWSQWYGPNAASFSASPGVTQIALSSITGLTTGSRVTLTNSSDTAQMEIKNITAINQGNLTVTLDSATSFTYSANSSFTDSYTDPNGSEPINPVNGSGDDDRWIQYRVFLVSNSGTTTPRFLENTVDYFTTLAVYQPDGINEGNGDNLYDPFGSGAGGAFTKNTVPGFLIQQPLSYNILIQNDGNADSVDDTYTLSWGNPSDISGVWAVLLNDGTVDLSSPVTLNLNSQAQTTYTMKVTPSSHAPGGSTQDIILNIRSDSEYAKADSIKATAQVETIYQADALIDGFGDNVYDASQGGGGTSSLKTAIPGDTITYSITLQNEGNIQDIYTLSLLNPPPAGWTVLINNGVKDYDITNPANSWTSPALAQLPSVNASKVYTLKIVPKGPPLTTDIVLRIYSNGTAAYMDSVNARLDLLPVYKVDGIIYGFAYNQTGNITDFGMGAGCVKTVSVIDVDVWLTPIGIPDIKETIQDKQVGLFAGDNVYGALGSGGGGCAAVDIPGGSFRDTTLTIQNEGNASDRYLVKWSIPSGWTVVLQERLNDGSIAEYGTQAIDFHEMYLPSPSAGNPAAYIGGESPSFVFRIIPSATFNSGFQTIIFDIKSANNLNKVDSVKLVVNSSDTTPPSPAVLTTGTITKTSVKVSWPAPGDDGMVGTAASYDLRYSTSPVTSDAEFDAATRVRGCKGGESNLNKPKAAGQAESCTVTPLYADTDYYFTIKTSDDAGNKSLLSTCSSSSSSCWAHTLISTDAVKPGTITDFTVKDIIITRDPLTLKEVVQASLCWSAPMDDSGVLSSGSVTAYEIRYSTRKIIEDGSVVSIGESLFSDAVTAVPLDGYLPPNSNGMQECYLFPIENKIALGGNIFDDRTRNTKFYFAVKGIDEARNKSLLSNVVSRLTPIVPYTYNLVSVPYVPVPSSPKDVFGDDVGTTLYTYWWRSSGTGWDNGCYDGEPAPHTVTVPLIPCSKLTQIREGYGYFLWAPPKDVTLDVPSGSLQAPVQTCGDSLVGTFNCYPLLLQEGTNIIGTTFEKEIYVTTSDVNNNSQTEGNELGLYIKRTKDSIVEIRSFQDAATVSPAWIDSSVYAHNGFNYTYETCGQDVPLQPLGSGCAISIQPWKAYLIRLNISDPNAVFELLIPN